MKPGPKPKPASDIKLRKSFRLSHETVAKLSDAVKDNACDNVTDGIEKAVSKWRPKKDRG